MLSATWANIEPDLCRYMAPLGHNVSRYCSKSLVISIPTHEGNIWNGFFREFNKFDLCCTFVILCMHPANERRRYSVTSSLIGWLHTQNDPWSLYHEQHFVYWRQCRKHLIWHLCFYSKRYVNLLATISFPIKYPDVSYYGSSVVFIFYIMGEL